MSATRSALLHRHLDLINAIHRVSKHFSDQEAEEIAEIEKKIDDEDTRWHSNLTARFETQIKDRHNFQLGENAVAIITAITTGLSMLLLIDIAFQLVIRMKFGRVSKHGIYRYHLMKQISNPLSWISIWFRWRKLADLIQRGLLNNLQRTQSRAEYPLYKKAIITLTGMLLITAEVGVIYLALNQNTHMRIDVSRVPAFTIKDKGDLPYIPLMHQGCMYKPFTIKPGFNSVANIGVCSSFSVQQLHPEYQLVQIPHAFMQFVISPKFVTFYIDYGNWSMEFDQYIATNISNGTQYESDNNIKPVDCRSALDSILKRFNVTVIKTESAPANSEGLFTEGAVVDPTGIQGFPEIRDQIDLILALAALMHGIIHTDGNSEGFVRLAGGEIWQLKEVTVPLVRNQRPWLGILPSLILWVLLLAFSVTLNFLGWDSSVDDRWAFKEVFSDTVSVDDFGKGADETLKLDWSKDEKGNIKLGYVSTRESDSVWNS